MHPFVSALLLFLAGMRLNVKFVLAYEGEFGPVLLPDQRHSFYHIAKASEGVVGLILVGFLAI